MADEASNIPSPFDLKTIRYLVQLMSRHDLGEIDLRQGDLRIRLRRGTEDLVPGPVVVPAAPTISAPAPAPTPPTPQTEAGKPTKPRVGSRVTPTTVVCIIEAMKIFNEIQAECSGMITEILVENQQPVEYGQVLFRVDPTA